MPIQTPAAPHSWRTILGSGLLAALIAAGCDSKPTSDSGSETAAATPTKTPSAEARTPTVGRPASPRKGPPPSGEPVVSGSLKVEPGMLDLGEIPPQSMHPLEFQLSNLGLTDITLILTKPTCLCTAIDDLAGRVIKPGESMPLAATFTAPTELGEKRAKVQVVFRQDGKEERVLIGFGGTITVNVQPDPPYVDARNGVETGLITLSSKDGRPFRVLSTDGAAPVFADGFDPRSDTPRSSYEIQWTIPDRSADNCRGMRLWWVIETDDADCPAIPVRVRHTCTGGKSDPYRRRRGWVFSEQIISLGAVTGGETVDATIKLTEMPMSTGAPGRADITGVRSITGGCDVELVSTERYGETYVMCNLRVTPSPEYRGMMYDMVRFESPTGSHEVAVVARVR